MQLPFSRSGNRTNGYVHAGGYLLRQIDLLIAVWDGKPPELGGTGAITRMAFDGGIPVVWISTTEDHVPRLITGFSASGNPNVSDADCTKGPLLGALMPIFSAPNPSAHRPRRRSGRARLERFLVEHWHPRCYAVAYDLLKRIANGLPPRPFIPAIPFEARCRKWDSFLKEAPNTHNLQERLKSIMLPRYVWADSLAIHYSHLYRNAYVLAYLVAAGAVFLALGSMTFETFEISQNALEIKVAFALAELLAISFIIGIVSAGRYFLWHERWLDYRALAETLRHGRFLAFVGEFGRFDTSSASNLIDV
jgi:hypothetical protein